MKNKDKKPEEAVRERLEATRTKLFIKYGEKGARRILIGVPVGIALFVILVITMLLLPIRQIEVSGEVTMFNEGEIIRAAGIEEGDSLYLRTSGKIEKTIRKNLPLTEKVRVTKTLFGKVRINVEFSDVDYYCKIGELYYAIDEELRILDSDESKTKYSAYGAVYVKLPETRDPVLGEKLVFYDTVEETDTEGETLYEVREVRYYDFASEFLTALKNSGFLPDSSAVILDERFNITLIYANKFQIKFGDVSDLDVKFLVLFGILDEGSMQYADKVSVDLTTPSKATARADNNLDFSEFTD